MAEDPAGSLGLCRIKAGCHDNAPQRKQEPFQALHEIPQRVLCKETLKIFNWWKAEGCLGGNSDPRGTGEGG